MREILNHFFLPQLAAASLMSLLGLLTWLGWRSKRGSALHRMRLWVLAALVSLSGGVSAGCGDDEEGGGEPIEQPSCYETAQVPSPDGGVIPPTPPVQPPVVQPACYMPVEVRPPTTGTPDAGPPRVVPSCYDPIPPRPPAPPDPGQQPPTLPPPEQQPMCYAPMPIQPPQPPPEEGSGGPQPSGVIRPDQQTPPRPRRMCYAPRLPRWDGES